MASFQYRESSIQYRGHFVLALRSARSLLFRRDNRSPPFGEVSRIPDMPGFEIIGEEERAAVKYGVDRETYFGKKREKEEKGEKGK